MMTVGRRTVVVAALATAGAIGLGGAVVARAVGTMGSDPAPTPTEVDATQRTLDDRVAGGAPVPASVASWGVDPAVGLLVVEVTGDRTPETDGFLAGLDPRTYQVRTGAEAPRTLSDG